MKKLVVFTALLSVVSISSLPSVAATYVWISGDGAGKFNNVVGHYREEGVPAANIIRGGNLADAWCRVSANGDTFVIVAHGGKLELEDEQGKITTYEGGLITINGIETSGFKRQGSNDNGTNSPCERPVHQVVELKAKELENITIQIWACWGGKTPTIVDGKHPWQNGKSVAQTMDEIVDFGDGNGNVNSPEGIYGWVACVNFLCAEGQGQGTPAWNAFWAAVNEFAQSQGNYIDVDEWLDKTPYENHGQVLEQISNFCTEEYNQQHGTNYRVNQDNPVDYSVHELAGGMALFMSGYGDLNASGCGDSVDDGILTFCSLAEPIPAVSDIPTVSEWGLIIMAGLLLTVGAVVIRRRFKTVPAVIRHGL